MERLPFHGSLRLYLLGGAEMPSLEKMRTDFSGVFAILQISLLYTVSQVRELITHTPMD